MNGIEVAKFAYAFCIMWVGFAVSYVIGYIRGREKGRNEFYGSAQSYRESRYSTDAKADNVRP